MFTPDPIGLPGVAAFMVGGVAFFVAVLVARARRAAGGAETGATRSGASTPGIVVQGIGIALAGWGRQRVTLDPLSTEALVEAVAVAVLMVGAVALFAWASRTMGRNWSIVARTRGDHQLVTTGPFRLVRHPIYTAMLLALLATALAIGHLAQLVLALPLFALGTGLRIRAEERLLADRFGAAHARYAAATARFVPGLF